MPGCYCSREHQKEDWKVHKKFHKTIAAREADRARDNFQDVDKSTMDALKQLDLDRGNGQTKFEHLMGKAIRFKVDGDEEESMKLVRKAIKVEPDNPMGHANNQLIWISCYSWFVES